MNKFISFFLLATISSLLIACQQQNETPQLNHIVPQVDSLLQQEGYFTLNKHTLMLAEDSNSFAVVEYAIDKLSKATGFSLSQGQNMRNSNGINWVIDTSIKQAEAYQLEVQANKIFISAATPAGLFYGFQTLLQLLPPQIESPQMITNAAWHIPCVSITDTPRFPYRGMHLDVCRHFVPVAAIKKHLDMMAMFKLNTFHWHLTEDQAWRIEIKTYPKLTAIGSQRPDEDGGSYGGYYSQEQIKDIVAYAAQRMIEVIPEIELPGHALAALTAYPEYSCTSGPFEVRRVWGVEPDVYCSGKESTFTFLEHIMEEVCQLFPSTYFHIGGDECPKIRWKTCPACQKRMRQEGLKNEHELQSYFVQRAEKILIKHGKKMIGWDEILEGGLAETATVMSWRGEQGGIEAAEQGHDVIMTPGNWCYLDHYQGSPKVEPVAIGGYTTLEETYSYEPVPQSLSPNKAKHILGTQGNVWTEYMYTPSIVEYRVYPRIIALAEVGWCRAEQKDFDMFVSSLQNIYPRMDYHNINYHIPMPEGPCNKYVFTDTAKLNFGSTRPIKMVYTIDGSQPSPQSQLYTTPLIFTSNTVLKIASLLPTGQMSPIRTIEIQKETLSPATPVDNVKAGLTEAYTQGYFSKASDIDSVTTWHKTVNATPHKPQNWRIASASVLKGYINIAKDGVYEFSSDLTQVYIDNVLLINNDQEVKRFSRHDAMRALAKGLHPIKIIDLNNIEGGWPSAWNERLIYYRQVGDSIFTKIEDDMYMR